LDWLTQEGGIPVPAREAWAAADLTSARSRAITMAGDLADMAAADPETVGLATLRLRGLADAAGLDLLDDGTAQADQGSLTAALAGVLHDTVLPILLGPGGAGFVRRVGPLAATPLGQMQSLVSRSDQFAARPVGQRLERGVLEWLFPAACGAELPASTRLTPADRLRGEVAIHLADQLPRMRPLATWVSLAEGADLRTVKPWFATAWPVEALVPLLDIFGDRLPPELWLGTVKAMPDAPALTAFCRRLVGTTWSPSPYAGQAVVAVAELRLLDQQWWRREHPEISKAVLGGSAAMTAPAIPFAPRVERDVQLAMIMAVLDPQVLNGNAQHLAGLAPLIEGRRFALPADVWDAVASYTSRVPTPDLVAGLASTDPELDLRSTPEQARWAWLGAITRDGVGLVRSLVKHRLTGQDAPNAATLVDQLKELPTRQPVADPRARERQLAAWVKELLPVRERGLGRLFGGAG
ncbi:MAG: hypothetical protein L0G99_12760, partial [Propionibacteriales bacterium]|nr:hypothetical protein [Propionibacteriales bacterium]